MALPHRVSGQHVRCVRKYTEVQQTFPRWNALHLPPLTSADLEKFWLVGVYALVGWPWLPWPCSSTAGAAVRPPATWCGGCGPVFRYGWQGSVPCWGPVPLLLFWYGFQQGNLRHAAHGGLPAGGRGHRVYSASMLLAKA